MKQDIQSAVLSEQETIWNRVVILKQGDSFGELALMDTKKGRRFARITSLERTQLGVISAENYHRCLARLEQRKRNQIENFFKDMPYFKSLDEEAMDNILTSMQTMKL